MTRGRPELLNQVAGLTARLSAAGIDAERAAVQAHAIIFRNVIAQATTLAYLDTFLYLAVASGNHVFPGLRPEEKPAGRAADHGGVATRTGPVIGFRRRPSLARS